jgi:myo-inositol-1(or 4)-monophosphatase
VVSGEDQRGLVLDLALRLRSVVLPELGSHAGRSVAGDGAGGDVTFAVDELAEASLAEFLAERAPRLAFYSEDRGLVAPPDASHVLVVDPIDGTRPAMAGLESACVAVALAPLGDGAPTMADVEIGCVVEIKSGDWYLAVRGSGVESTRPVALSPTVDVGRMFWGYGFRGRPVRETVEVLAELIDASSVGGGTFELGSQAFAMTRIVTGQFDAVIEVGSRLIDELPAIRDAFERVGGGQVLNNSPYDLAAVAVPARGGRRRERRLGRTARSPPAPRRRPRVPDVVNLRFEPAAARTTRTRRRYGSRAAPGAVRLRCP